LPGFFICIAMVDGRGFYCSRYFFMRPSSRNSVKEKDKLHVVKTPILYFANH